MNEVTEQKIKLNCPTLYSILKQIIIEKQADCSDFGEVYQ